MKNNTRNPQGTAMVTCRCCPNRRDFIKTACQLCVCAAAPAFLPGVRSDSVAEVDRKGNTSSRPRVRLVFACFATKQDRPTWPHIGYDFAPEIERVTSGLRTLCPEVEFIPAVATGPDDAKKLLEAHDADRIDGYVVYQMNNWVQVMQTIVAYGKPTLIADFPFAGSGGFMVYTAGLRRKHRNMSVVASSRLEDLAASAKCFTLLKSGASPEDFAIACDKVRRERTPQPDTSQPKSDKLDVAPISKCLEAMKKSKLLTVGGKMQNLIAQIRDVLGIEVVEVDFKELTAACERADAEKAREIAAAWKSSALRIQIDDETTTLEQSARNYLGQRILLNEYGAEGITINCLGGFYGGHLKAYPCLGFVELLNAVLS